MKKLSIILALLVAMSLAACTPVTNGTTGTSNNSSSATDGTTSQPNGFKGGMGGDMGGMGTTTDAVNYVAVESASYDAADYYFDYTTKDYTTVDVASSPTITKSGTYILSGKAEASITINVDKNTDEGVVYLVMNGLDLTNNKTAPINILEAKRVVIMLVPDTENTITQGANITVDDGNDPSAAIFSKADLTITGDGKLTINTAFNDGITSKDDLKITGGDINITAVNDGLVGKDLLAINDGTITIDAGKDGMRSTNETDAGEGVVVISGGNFTIKSGDDAIQGFTGTTISGGTFKLTATGKGIRADGMVLITDGNITIDAQVEGIEGANTTISGGTINITAADDGINVNDTKGTMTFSGGKVSIKAGGDGIDSNGNIVQSGGEIVIDTTVTGGGDTPVDYDGTFTSTGGTLVDQNGDTISHQAGMPGGGGGGGRGQRPDGMTMPDGTTPPDGMTPPDGFNKGTRPNDTTSSAA